MSQSWIRARSATPGTVQPCGWSSSAGRTLAGCVMLVTVASTTFALGQQPGETAPVETGQAVDADAVVRYVLSCRKTNGAFGPRDQQYTDAAWNFPAVRTLKLLQAAIPEPEKILAHGSGYPQGHGGMGHWLVFHQQLLRRDLQPPAKRRPVRPVKLVHQGFQVNYYGNPFLDDKKLYATDGQFALDAFDGADEMQWYNLSSLYYLLAALEPTGRPIENREELADYIRTRQSPGGGFVDVRTADGKPTDEDAHVAYTHYALSSLRMLDQELPRRKACIRFVQASQLASGAFESAPQAAAADRKGDVYYTHAALKSLALLGSRPKQVRACINWLNSLQNVDGGFGDKPHWRSRLYSTYWAVDALSTLSPDPRQAIAAKQLARAEPQPVPAGRFRIYQGLFKTPVVAPDELVELGRRGFNLIGLKHSEFDVCPPLLERNARDRLFLDVVLCPELYPHRAVQPGGTLVNHIANVTLDPLWTPEQRAIWNKANQAGTAQLAWPEYQRQVIAPLVEVGALVYPEHDFELEFALRAYDDGLAGRGGYNAVLAGFNWEPRDFVRVFPWRERYVDKLVPVADADAHGDLAKWSPQLDHTRHLYLADGPAYEHFQQAAALGRVVCVIHRPGDTASPVTYYGRPEVVDYLRQREADWRWW